MAVRLFRSAWMTISRWVSLRGAIAVALATGLLLGWGLDRAAIAQFRSGPSTSSGQTSTPLRTQWEYRSTSTSEESDPGNARFFRDLSDLGEEGFEMVTCLYAQERRDERSTTVCYFKRPH